MIVWIVRHGYAGSKADWWGDDAARPLDDAGRIQAEGLVPLFADVELTHLVSSPTTRCIETLLPLSAAVGLPIEASDDLRHEATPVHVLDLIERSGAGSVLCTHGEVMEPLLDALGTWGITVPLHQEVRLLRKGAVWRLDLDERTLDLAAAPSIVE